MLKVLNLNIIPILLGFIPQGRYFIGEDCSTKSRDIIMNFIFIQIWRQYLIKYIS